MKKIKITIKGIMFTMIFCFIFNIVQEILLNKDGNYYKQKTIYSLKENTIDLILVGSSHNDAGFVPKVFDNILELESYNMGKTGARIEQVEYLIKEHLKAQNPKVIVIEGFSFVPIAKEHVKVLANWSFDSFDLSFNKVEAILNTTEKNKINHIFPLLEYHERWKVLKKKDFSFYKKIKNSNKGWGAGNTERKFDKWFDNDFSSVKEIRKINRTEEKSLENIIKMCKKKNIKLFIVTLPYKNQLGFNALEMVKVNNYLEKTYKEDLIVLDLNKKYKELNVNSKEFVDEGHLNQKGAYKYSKYVAEFLKGKV